MVEDSRFGKTVRFYRKTVFGCAQAVTAQDELKTPTINLELANANNFKLDPSSKLIIQVSSVELPIFIQVVLRFRERFDAKFHTPTKNHSYHVWWENSQFHWMISHAGDQRFIILNASDRFYLSQLALDQLRSKFEGWTIQDIIALLKNV